MPFSTRKSTSDPEVDSPRSRSGIALAALVVFLRCQHFLRTASEIRSACCHQFAADAKSRSAGTRDPSQFNDRRPEGRATP